MTAAATVAFVLLASVVGFFVLYALIQRETADGETMDRAEAERRARNDTDDARER